MHSWLIERAYWISMIGWYHLAVFVLWLPIMAAVAFRRTQAGPDAPLPDRLKQFRTMAVMLVLYGGLSLLAARSHYLNLLPARLDSPAVSIAAGVAMYLVAVAFMRPRWRRAVEQRKRIVYLFMPQTSAERGWWIAISVLAGVSEEITWRGMQPILLTAMTGSVGMGVVGSALLFGLGHAPQGQKSAGIIAVFALGFHGLVWLSGSLYVAMAVHIVYDLTAGFTYAKLGRELGYQIA